MMSWVSSWSGNSSWMRWVGRIPRPSSPRWFSRRLADRLDNGSIPVFLASIPRCGSWRQTCASPMRMSSVLGEFSTPRQCRVPVRLGKEQHVCAGRHQAMGNRALRSAIRCSTGSEITPGWRRPSPSTSATEAQVESFRRGLLMQATNARLNVRAAQKRMETARKAQEEALDVLNSVSRRYETGGASNVDLIDVQTAYTSAKTNYITACLRLPDRRRAARPRDGNSRPITGTRIRPSPNS